ncbi:MAG: hypothetical protein WAU77_09645 [Solirubrobacteraceae bacterium]|jgi:hypothetical protein
MSLAVTERPWTLGAIEPVGVSAQIVDERVGEAPAGAEGTAGVPA